MNDTSTTLWGLYREIHKAIRWALAGVTTLAGQTDAADAGALARLRDEWQQAALVLAGHHRHEETYFDPLIRRYARGLLPAIETAHQRSDIAVARLHRLADGLMRAGTTNEAGTRLCSFALELGAFTSMILVHLRDEEDRVMPALNAAMSDDEIASVTAAIRDSVKPQDMCIFVRCMVPAMHVAERHDVRGGMQVGAPPAFFERRHAAVSRRPGDASWRRKPQ